MLDLAETLLFRSVRKESLGLLGSLWRPSAKLEATERTMHLQTDQPIGQVHLVLPDNGRDPKPIDQPTNHRIESIPDPNTPENY